MSQAVGGIHLEVADVKLDDEIVSRWDICGLDISRYVDFSRFLVILRRRRCRGL